MKFISGILMAIAPLTTIADSNTQHEPQAIADLIAEVPSIGEVHVSPDGKWIVYSILRRSLAINKRTNWKEGRVYLQRLSPGSDPLPPPIQLPEGIQRFSIQWHPDGNHFSMLNADGDGPTEFALYDVRNGKTIPVRFKDSPDAVRSRPPIENLSTRYSWSPSGRYLVFVSAVEHPQGLNPRAGRLVQTNELGTGSLGGIAARRGLFELEVGWATSNENTHVMTPDLNDADLR